MSDPVPHHPAEPAPAPAPPPVSVAPPIRLTEPLYWAAAFRLVSQHTPDRAAAAGRLVSGAAAHGIDLSFTWGILDPSPRADSRVRQVCLAVLGSGRTAMLFISEPAPEGDPGGSAVARVERAACIDAACRFLGEHHSDEARIAQALPDPRDTWAVEAFREAGFLHVGDLSYMRSSGVAPGQAQPVVWPDEVRVVRVDELGDRRAQDAALITALDRSYIDTLDCPELCGLRETTDILQSHRATGRWDPALWWVVLLRGSPEGCLLLNRAQDRGCVELVYLGLSPALRGLGLGSKLLRFGLSRVGKPAPTEVNCAVDERNAPALKLYHHAGFSVVARRVALVRALHRARHHG